MNHPQAALPAPELSHLTGGAQSTDFKSTISAFGANGYGLQHWRRTIEFGHADPHPRAPLAIPDHDAGDRQGDADEPGQGNQDAAGYAQDAS